MLLVCVCVAVQVQKILQSSQQKEGLELRTLLTNPHLQVRCQLANFGLSYLHLAYNISQQTS